MPGVWDGLNERKSGQSPSSGTIGSKTGAAHTAKYTVTNDQLDEAMRTALELAWENATNFGLNRQNPIAHQRYAWCYATSISYQGVSYDSRRDGGPVSSWEVPPIRYGANYTEYELTLAFSQRPYPMMKDENLGEELLLWYKDDGSVQVEAVVPEWARNVEWLCDPGGEFLTADIGTFKFVRTGAGFPENDQSAGRGSVKVSVPTTNWTAIWHCVPYRWLTATNNVFDRAKGRVNQIEWEGFRPGTLLFQGAKVLDRPYTHPFPDTESWEGKYYPVNEKLVDIALTFVERNVRPFEVIVPTNSSFIADGHNLVPYAKTGRWYYAITRGEAAAGIAPEPIYRSYPLQFLFMNPDGAPSP